VKTPSFLELKSLVEYLSDELEGSQLQEIMSTTDGMVMAFYRFNKNPRMSYLVLDLDKVFPFLGFFTENPWGRLKKTKPVALFLSAHAKNQHFKNIQVFEDLGRVVRIELSEECRIEFRLIPKQANLIIEYKKKSISWYPVKELAQNDLKYTQKDEEEIRSISFMMSQWVARRGAYAKAETASALSPFEKWKKNKARDLEKKTKALAAIRKQIDQFKNEEWALVGEYLKMNGLKNLKPEWSVYIDFEKSVSANMQKCFEKAKAAKTKVLGAENRVLTLQQEIESLADLSEKKFEEHLQLMSSKKNKAPARVVEGRLRKIQLEESGLVAYLGKSAADNMDLLRKAKPYDIWLHLKDYPSAHAIIHKQKDQGVSDQDIYKVGSWLVKEGLSDKQIQQGGKFSIVFVECRHVKPLKGDKLGRVTFRNAREVLIAL
jgi:predicted ribosome quality control (RQC) complex YloA/Tae2 family protein